LRRIVFIGGAFFLTLLGCVAPLPKEPVRPVEPVVFQERKIVPLLTDDADRNSLQTAVDRSLTYLSQKISAKSAERIRYGFSENMYAPEMAYRSLALFREILLNNPDEKELSKKVRQNFSFWEAKRGGRANPVLLTGYYEPILEGSLTPGGEYLFPIYRRPDDLVELAPWGEVREKQVVRFEKGRMVPYYSRQEIDNQGVLLKKGYELAWLKDPWERFVLHVQGSGQIRLPDGRILRVGFAASNGRPYRSIGRHLMEKGFFPEKDLSLGRVMEFIRQNPEKAEETFNVNERYIFFRLIPGPEGPIGALGLPLTAGRSIATDQAIFPRGALAYLVSQQTLYDQAGRRKGKKPLQRFVLNQDTGAAMKGPERVDLFFGSGDNAGRFAGDMREDGEIFFLQASVVSQK